MKTLKHVALVVSVGLIMGIWVYGCATVKGAGKDVGSLGQGIENASDAVAN